MTPFDIFYLILSFVKNQCDRCRRKTRIQTSETLIEDITTEEKQQVIEEEKKPEINVEDDIFTSVDFTKKCVYLNSEEINDLLAQNKSKLEIAKDIEEKVFYFSRLERFPVYGIRNVIRKELDTIFEEDNDELILAILNVLEWELSMPYYVKHFYRCKTLYYKLLSARPILQRIPIYYETLHEETGKFRCVYKDVKDFFLERGRDQSESVNVRADCLDALVNFCSDSKQEANKAIEDMGQLYTDNKEKTIYTNSQNIHSKGIQDSAIASLKNLASYYHPEANLDQIYELILVKLCDNIEKREKVIKSLKRIVMDSTKINALSISQILSIVWKEIERQRKYKEELENRLIEELYEADDTCTSGFFTRFINVLVGYSPLVKIQIYPEEDAEVKIVALIKNELNGMSTLEKERLTVEILDKDPDPSSFRNQLKSQTKKIIEENNNIKELKETVGEEKLNEIIEKKLDAFFG